MVPPPLPISSDQMIAVAGSEVTASGASTPVNGVIKASVTAKGVDPQPHDVLCGKDKTYSLHLGNKLFREQIETNVGPYAREKSKLRKMMMTREIVKKMNEQFKARFLKMNKQGEWEEISTQAARDKASHALRFAARHSAEKVALAAEGLTEPSRPKTMAAYQAEVRSRITTISAMANASSQGSERSVGDKVEIVSPPVVPPVTHDEPEFNSMRTADLEEILAEPLQEDEWEAVSALAMVNTTNKSSSPGNK